MVTWDFTYNVISCELASPARKLLFLADILSVPVLEFILLLIMMSLNNLVALELRMIVIWIEPIVNCGLNWMIIWSTREEYLSFS